MGIEKDRKNTEGNWLYRDEAEGERERHGGVGERKRVEGSGRD